MAELDDADTHDGDALLRALAWTPEVAPFAGTPRYQMSACLGEGGFGIVYEVEDRELGRPVALKLLKPLRAGYAEQVRRLKREFRSVADLVHPNLVGLHELVSHGTRWFFTMELVRGHEFREHVGASEARLRAALAQLVTGVAVLHDAGIIHRDLKPSNVLVEPGGRVVILDFGLAYGEDTEPESAAAGTPQFMAPEQAVGGPVTTATDWYAVGLMLEAALAQLAIVPEDLERLCRGLLRPDPTARPCIADIAAALGDPALAAPRRRDAHGVFVGRGRELAELRAGHARLAAGAPSVIRIPGQPGVGKSALLAQFLDELRRGDALVLASRCHEREAVPYKAFDGVIDALVAHLGALPADELAALVPADLALAAQLFPALEPIAGTSQATVPVDRREARLASFAALEQLLARVAQRRRVVIAVDDLQWSDVDSARLLSHLIAPPRPRVLFVLAYRTGESPIVAETLRMLDAAGDRGRELALGSLPAPEAEQLAAHLLGPARAAAAAGIAERGEGHPLFIVELARAGAVAAPTLLDMLWQRVTALSADARALLETVAIAGGPLPAGVGYAAAALGDDALDAMRLLRAEHLIRADERDVLAVYHDRIRDAVLERGDAAARRGRHLALARCLEAAPASDSAALARHYDAAGEPAAAARHAVRAGDTAMAGLAFDRAAAMYRLAIERAAPTAELLEKLGTALDSGGYSLAAGEAYMAGAEHATGDTAIDLLRRGAEHLLVVGDVERGMRALERAMAAVGERLPPTLGRARFELVSNIVRYKVAPARPRLRDGAPDAAQLRRLDVLDSAIRGLDGNDPVRAIALRGRHCRHAIASGDPRRTALGLMHVIYCYAGKEYNPAIDASLDHAEAIGTQLGDPTILAYAQLERAMMAFAYGNWPATAAHAARAAQQFADECVGMGNERRLAQFILAGSKALMGELADARRIANALLLDAVERGDPVTEKNICGSVLARLALADDDVISARELVARIATEDRCPSVMMRGETAALLAAYSGRPGDGVFAWQIRWQLIEDMGVLHVGGFRVMVARSFGTALFARAADRRDLREAARMTRSIARKSFPWARASLAQLRTLRALHDRRYEAAASFLDEAAQCFATAHMPLDVLACRYRLGQLLADPRAVADADAQLRRAGVVNPERWTAMTLPL